MGNLVGHVVPGLLFLLVGLWQLLNHIKLHCLHPKSYTALAWFPTSKFRYLELYLIMTCCGTYITTELFVGPTKHQPLDSDGTIPTTHLHNFEHSNITMTFFMYAAFAIILDKIQPPAQYGLTQLLGVIAFANEFLLFHLHSTDHTGVEGQYHWLLQVVILVSLFTTVLGMGYPKSFLNCFIRSLSIFFQGVWQIVMGIMVWTPEFVPKGCFLVSAEVHKVVKCHNDAALGRAKSLVNIEFTWYVMGITIFAICLYLALYKMYPEEKAEYQSLTKFEDPDEEQDEVEAQKSNKFGVPTSFLPVGKSFPPADKERNL